MDWTKYSEVYYQYNTGIYALVNLSRNRVYVGATYAEFVDRWATHRWSLEKGTHESHSLQRDWWLDGPHAFTFLILQEIHHAHPRMDIYEQFWLDGFRDAGLVCYNSAAPVTKHVMARPWLAKPGQCLGRVSGPPVVNPIP